MEPNNTREETTKAAAGQSPRSKGTGVKAPEASEALGSASAETPVKIPPILLEGDEPSASAAASLEQQFEAAPAPTPEPLETEEGELPETYGTGRLLLAARDPHCLYAHWDATAEEQHCYRDQPGHAQLVMRVYLDSPSGRPVTELPVHPESRHWFIPVERGGANYIAELGCYGPQQEWHCLATSETVTTPRGKQAEERPVEFATVFFEPPSPPAPEAPHPTAPAPTPAAAPAPPPAPALPPAVAPAKPALPSYAFLPLPPPGPALPSPLEEPPAIPPETGRPPITQAEAESVPEAPQPPAMEAPEFVRAHPRQNGPVPTPVPAPVPPWSAGQQAALAELFGQTFVAAQPQPSSAELAGFPRPLLENEIVSSQAPAFPAPLPSPISSPTGGAAPERKAFWFNVNAELVIYGATEPDAQVTIRGQPIQLRPDGTFSLRFALPDGQFELTATATSLQGETRSAELKFQRETQYRGQVGVHPQDPALKPPDDLAKP